MSKRDGKREPSMDSVNSLGWVALGSTPLEPTMPPPARPGGSPSGGGSGAVGTDSVLGRDAVQNDAGDDLILDSEVAALRHARHQSSPPRLIDLAGNEGPGPVTQEYPILDDGEGEPGEIADGTATTATPPNRPSPAVPGSTGDSPSAATMATILAGITAQEPPKTPPKPPSSTPPHDQNVMTTLSAALEREHKALRALNNARTAGSAVSAEERRQIQEEYEIAVQAVQAAKNAFRKSDTGSATTSPSRPSPAVPGSAGDSRPKHKRVRSRCGSSRDKRSLIILLERVESIPQMLSAFYKMDPKVRMWVKRKLTDSKPCSNIVEWPARTNTHNPVWNLPRRIVVEGGNVDVGYLHIQLLLPGATKVGTAQVSLGVCSLGRTVGSVLMLKPDICTVRFRKIEPLPSPTKYIFLIRHAESEWNRGKATKAITKMMSQIDHPLTRRGWRQALLLNKSLRVLFPPDKTPEKLNTASASGDGKAASPGPVAESKSSVAKPAKVDFDLTTVDYDLTNQSVDFDLSGSRPESPGTTGDSTEKPGIAGDSEATPSASVAGPDAKISAQQQQQSPQRQLESSPKKSSPKKSSPKRPIFSRYFSLRRQSRTQSSPQIPTLNVSPSAVKGAAAQDADLPTTVLPRSAKWEEPATPTDGPVTTGDSKKSQGGWMLLQSGDEMLTESEKKAEKMLKTSGDARAKKGAKRRLDTEPLTAKVRPRRKDKDGRIIKDEFYDAFASATSVLCSPLTRAVETCVLCMRNHPMWSRESAAKINLFTNLREKKGFWSRDTMGRDAGSSLVQRVAKSMSGMRHGGIKTDLVNRINFNDCTDRWWNNSKEGEDSFQARLEEFANYIRYSEDRVIIAVGHSGFFRHFVNKYSAPELRAQKPFLVTLKLQNCELRGFRFNTKRLVIEQISEMVKIS